MNLLQKLLRIPRTNETVVVESVQLWEVRWHSRYHEYAGGMRPEVEAFPTREEAERFAASLTNAYRLLRHTSGTTVTVEKAKSYA